MQTYTKQYKEDIWNNPFSTWPDLLLYLRKQNIGNFQIPLGMRMTGSGKK